MLRGRHRGLPVAIDRAVMLPEFELDDQMELQRRMSLNTNRTSADLAPRGGDGTSLPVKSKVVRRKDLEGG